MGLMSDLWKRGYEFDGASGLKTGANLEDLVTRAVPVSGTQLVDQVTLEDYADSGVTDDSGASLRRLRVKDNSIGPAKLTVDAFWGGPELLNGTIFATPAAAAAAMVVSTGWTVAPSTVANIFDGDISTSWGATCRCASNTLVYWDLGAVYRGNLFLALDVKTGTSETARACPFCLYDTAPTSTLMANDDFGGVAIQTTSHVTGTAVRPFFGRYVGITFSSSGGASVWPNVRRFEVYGRAV